MPRTEEIERVEAELFAMPEKGQWLPKVFGGKAARGARARRSRRRIASIGVVLWGRFAYLLGSLNL